jgi:hypothetical protein
MRSLKRAVCLEPPLQRASQRGVLPYGSPMVFCCSSVVARSLAGGICAVVALAARAGGRWQSRLRRGYVRKMLDYAVDRLASEAHAVAGGVDSLQSCNLDVSVAVIDWCWLSQSHTAIDGQSVWTRYSFFLESYYPVHMGRPLRREVGVCHLSVIVSSIKSIVTIYTYLHVIS